MKYLPYIFILILSVFALKALFASPFLPLMHDQVQAERVYELAKSLSFGQFPVRYVGDLGYGFGYPLFNYYAPLPYYEAAVLFLLGINLITATKIMIAGAFIMAGIGMYLFAKQFWGKSGALLSATLYLLAPYHGVQLYVRGSVGELYTYALIPFICIGLGELWKESIHKKKVVLGIMSLGLLSFSHTLGIFMTLFLIALYYLGSILYLYNKRKAALGGWIKRNVVFMVVALSLGAFFWIPAFTELRYTNFSIASGNKVNYADHFVTLKQLWSSPWGFGGSTKGDAADGLSFMIGKIAIILTIAVILSLIAMKYKMGKHKIEHQGIVLTFLLVAFISIFLMTEASLFIWKTLPYMPIIQFPWRFLLFTSFSLCFISGAVYATIRAYLPRKYFISAVTTSILLVAVSLLFPSQVTNKLETQYFEKNGDYKLTDAELKNPQHLRFEASRISDEYMPKSDFKPALQSEVSVDSITCTALCLVKNVVIEPSRYVFTVKNEKNSPVFIDKLYYPEFTATVDGAYAEVQKGPHTMLGVRVPAGEHRVELILKNTWTRTFSNTISVISFLCLLLYPVRGKLWNMKLKQKLLKI